MTLSAYRCLQCKQFVSEEHDGPPVREEQKVLCTRCCRESLRNLFDAATCGERLLDADPETISWTIQFTRHIGRSA